MLPQQLTNIRARRVSFVDRAAVRDPANPTEPRRFVLFKSQGSEPDIPTKGAPVLTDAQKAELDPDVLAHVEKAEKDAADAAAEVEKAAKSAADEKTAREAAEQKLADMKKADEPPEEIDKADLPEPVRAALEKAEAREAAAEERIAKAEKEAEEGHKLAKAERETRVSAEWIAKAETGELRGLPGAPADIGPVMKSLAEAAPEAWATFEKSVLVPAVAQIKQGEIFKEQGRGGEGPPPESALGRFNKEVGEVMKAQNITKSEAIEAVRKADPELQKEIAREVRA